MSASAIEAFAQCIGAFSTRTWSPHLSRLSSSIRKTNTPKVCYLCTFTRSFTSLFADKVEAVWEKIVAFVVQHLKAGYIECLDKDYNPHKGKHLFTSAFLKHSCPHLPHYLHPCFHRR